MNTIEGLPLTTLYYVIFKDEKIDHAILDDNLNFFIKKFEQNNSQSYQIWQAVEDSTFYYAFFDKQGLRINYSIFDSAPNHDWVLIKD